VFNIVGGGIDYKSGSYKVKIPSGQTSTQFKVLITDDNLLEENENFVLIIDPSSIPSDIATAGNPNQTTVTITDNDG